MNIHPKLFRVYGGVDVLVMTNRKTFASILRKSSAVAIVKFYTFILMSAKLIDDFFIDF